ncbi:hypothetical protein TL16_g11091 [Triparma laevis f. inornata]|uniref:Proline dehydrogenase n=1 Tax=Triparma laevis f. inornata TaxID=1714386 RepID=A0A9W7ESG3_9STRA|nr:hypothetical protein TL16_g11091 [Triparma laevis f. inornata]
MQGSSFSTKVDFDDTKLAYGSKSTLELVRSYAVFQLCSVPIIVRNANNLYTFSKKVFPPPLVDGIIKRTFFAHFCGGETTSDLRPCISMLDSAGVSGILDYAAENAPDEVEEEKGCESDESEGGQPARVYDYVGEKECDHHVQVFKQCITAVKDVTPRGFAALKLTALGNPILLERLSTAIVETRKLFEQFDRNGDGVVSREEFEEAYKDIFVDAEEKLPEILRRLDPEGTGEVDYVEWSKLLQPTDLPRLVAGCREEGPLSKATPTPEELELMTAMKSRLWEIANLSKDLSVRLLIDAEQTYYQPAIDNYVLELQKEFNSKSRTENADVPIIFNTYQCYLKDSQDRVKLDLLRATRSNYHFAAKLVRGAYMLAERERAEKLGYASPINDTIEDTHNMYNDTVSMLMEDRKVNNTKNEVMIASHNRTSVESAIKKVEELGIDNKSGAIHFAQLLGMRDDLSFSLGCAGFNAYKYVPYGKVKEVMPYLIRRAQENSDITKGMGEELKGLGGELKRRFF